MVGCAIVLFCVTAIESIEEDQVSPSIGGKERSSSGRV